MRGEQLLEQMEYIDSGLIESAADPKKKAMRPRRAAIWAACIAAACLISAVGICSVVRSRPPESIAGVGGAPEANGSAERIFLKIDGRIVRYEYHGSEQAGADSAGEELKGMENAYQDGEKYRVYKLKGHEDCAQLLFFDEAESIRTGEEDWSLWKYAGIAEPKGYTISEDLSYFGIGSAADIQKVKTSWWNVTDAYETADFPVREYTDRETIERFYAILVSAEAVDMEAYFARDDAGKADTDPTDGFSDVTNFWAIELYTKEGSVYEYRMNRSAECLDCFYGDACYLISQEDWDWMADRCGFEGLKEPVRSR